MKKKFIHMFRDDNQSKGIGFIVFILAMGFVISGLIGSVLANLMAAQNETDKFRNALQAKQVFGALSSVIDIARTSYDPLGCAANEIERGGGFCFPKSVCIASSTFDTGEQDSDGNPIVSGGETCSDQSTGLNLDIFDFGFIKLKCTNCDDLDIMTNSNEQKYVEFNIHHDSKIDKYKYLAYEKYAILKTWSKNKLNYLSNKLHAQIIVERSENYSEAPLTLAPGLTVDCSPANVNNTSHCKACTTAATYLTNEVPCVTLKVCSRLSGCNGTTDPYWMSQTIGSLVGPVTD